MSANFGELVLLIGDYHIPSRSTNIPEQFQKMLVPNKMQHIICTGNIGTKEEYDKLRNLVGGSSTCVHCVAGEYDITTTSGDNNASAISSSSLPSFPETKVIRLGQFRIGIIGGHQVVPWGDLNALGMVRRKLNVDILVCGNRRKEGVVEHEVVNKLCQPHASISCYSPGGHYIFPGSITGAYSATAVDVNPSFILLAVQNNKVVCYVYEMKNGEVDVSKTEFSKQ